MAIANPELSSILLSKDGGSGIIRKINFEKLTPSELVSVFNAICKKMAQMEEEINTLKREKMDK